ncbi:MAG: 50S ribosomal protein L24 [bacterium]|nr:50S ribosomal protein L24 [bacterium]MDZ4226078.1 50S ribosomal protein L24 [Patescibacteria group bacterium]
MHVKKGDNVVIIAGKDKGKIGKIVRAFPREDSVIVEGVNAKKVHERAKKSGGKGTIVEKNFPIHVSNVKLHGKS